MRLLKKLLIGLAGFAALTAVGGYATYKYMNRTPAQLVAPNYYDYYLSQDTVPEGRVGIFISSLIMPEDYRIEDYFLLAQKAKQYIPWPINISWVADRGVLLLDPARPYEFEQFAPEHLVDAWGRDTDLDGLAYVDKLHGGEIEWVPPNPRLHLDHGYFLLKTRQEGMPTVAAKLATKALTYYYGIGIKGHKIPHEAGMRAIVEPAMQEIQARYGPIEWRWVTADNFGLARKAMHELLDTGVDTVLLAAPAPIYSHHEEFNGAIRHAMHYIHEWQEKHGHKAIKVIIQPQLGNFPVLRQTWVNMLRDRLDQIPTGSAVKVVMSVHGMAWDRVPNEAWIQLAPAYRDTTLLDLKALLDTYDFSRRDAILAQDHFADHINNPDGKYLSTNQAFKDGIRDDFDYVINIPIEFFAENTDTLFSHAMINFEDIPGFDRYEQVDYPDWTVPYVREIVVDGTHLIYNGVPAGKYNQPIIAAFVQALETVLAQAPERTAMRSAQP